MDHRRAQQQQQGAAAPEPEETTMEVDSLPLETPCPPFPLRQYNGFWIPELTQRRGVPGFRSRFTPRPSDIILASFPKSGTTWLKALAFATLRRAAHPPSFDGHPLRCANPHVRRRRRRSAAFTFEEAFDLFCDGRCVYGPPWLYALDYWEAGRRRPGNVLFLRYEKMLLQPRNEIKSFHKLKNMEVNKNGTGKGKFPVENADFFRKGVAGDWRIHMTPEMAQRLDRIVEDALQGSPSTTIQREQLAISPLIVSECVCTAYCNFHIQ
ncbi:hypothetical protein QOZ80_1AG0003000 [Eleusine coracana subsp. coracana]|nr:hypothetical protein QOZ80_1AG0003000 [Eleusine coracana subsp. coracana]